MSNRACQSKPAISASQLQSSRNDYFRIFQSYIAIRKETDRRFMTRDRSRDRFRRHLLPLSMDATRSSGAAEYRYKPLSDRANEIRLINLVPCDSPNWKYHTSSIKCDIFVVPLDEAPEYEALSYAWGHNYDLSSISLDGSDFDVRKNLKSALFELRSRTERRILWIDAICIDQTNIRERSEQVAKVRTIYARASNVLVWLGRSSKKSDLAFSLLHELYDQLHNEETVRGIIRSPENLQHVEGISVLFSREYWWRVWVIQEVNFARSITVHCGGSKMNWGDMIAVQDILRRNCDPLLDHLSASYRNLRGLHQSVQFRGPQSLLLDRVGVTNGSGTLDLFDALMMHRLKDSTDPRDKIYALVGLTATRDDPEFAIDYSRSVRQVYIDTVDNILLRSQHLDFICAKTRGIERLDLPSWVPNWASTGSNCPIPYRHAVKRSAYCASGRRNTKAHICKTGILHAEGIVISPVKAVSQTSGVIDMYDYRGAIMAINTWHIFLTDNLGRDNAKSEEFSRLLLSEIIEPEDLLGNTLSTFLQFLLGGVTKYGQQMWPDMAMDPMLLRFASSVNGSEGAMRRWVEVISQMFFMRRLFITTEGVLGLAEEAIMEGDVICILFGCSIPIVLRLVDNHYIYVSDACVVGYMFGKGVEDWEQGKLQTQMFEIH